ncbi:hypothetical protein COCC4DRAFT_76859 [Bipolaris maydis ATCC 48331]|uniref:Uncharacterized protein n=2 Tax=Cochliobolus heterostrophus TaxID=5016 RepID=M2TT59_COCH5|nr:uncharacterized protein COCC4DRAFT_76859 [Bipolaris maydis ATCC 48331]EMD84966.1 hypothetical protein COCHEDRAFT_1199189 [Bipolaris maydis C5]KAJ5027517.1 hypothetical protein J3E73DRAFT_431422 [Bipolaris maydis]ENH98926.1 hypothetical protein COCC4DRAFT_76859 [Bipolaris maydis ATCC 48331]KAJ6208673.1 hypothetical protein PSV09DRAFT_1199189 [Bipolaris maydis]KAJ6270584.1 hypothetical protein PSV08DRAFT_223026 [Bipolaris maydis]
MTLFSDSSVYRNFLVSPLIPPEIVLQTIQHIPFGNGALMSALRNAHPRLRTLMSTYEQSLARYFMQNELRHAERDFACEGDFSFDWLAECVRNYDMIDDVMDALCSDHNFNAIMPHNTFLAYTGLLLIHRMSLLDDRQGYIESLQRDGLIAIYLVLHHSTLAARYHGSGWISQRTYGHWMQTEHFELRNELEFCFAEAALSIGPEFISDTLLHHDQSDCEATLLNFYHDYGIHDWEWPCLDARGGFEPPRTQGPQRKQDRKERSLFTTLLKCLAERMQCELGHVRERVERNLENPRHPLANLTLGGKQRLLKGKDLDER